VTCGMCKRPEKIKGFLHKLNLAKILRKVIKKALHKITGLDIAEDVRECV